MERHPPCRDGCRTGRALCARGVCVLAVGTANEPGPSTIDPPEAARIRRARKPRIALGQKQGRQ